MPTIILKSPEGEPITLQDIYRVLLQGTEGPVPFGYIQTNKSETISSASGTIIPDTGYGGMDEVAYTVASGSVTIPNTTITANLTISVDSATGKITATVSGSEPITPEVTAAGYISSVTGATASVSDSKESQLTTLIAKSYDPTSSDQTITAGQYLTGDQTIRGVTYTMTDSGSTSTLNASVIKKDVVVNIGTSNDAGSVVSITGQYAGQNIREGPVTVTPTLAAQTILPSSYNLDYFNEVDIPEIKATENGSQRAVVSTDIRSGVTILGQAGNSDVVNTDSSGFASGESAITSNTVLSGYSGFVDGQKVSGTIDDNGSTGGTISTVSGTITIPAGYTTGGTVQIAPAEQAKIIASNIRSGETILGQPGGLFPRPNWVACSEYSWNRIYFNRNIDWGTILPLLDYYLSDDDFNAYILGAAGNSLASGYMVWALEFTNSNKYGIFTLSDNGVSPVYATDDINETIVIAEESITFVANAGWNNTSLILPNVDPIYCVTTVTYTGGSIDGSKMFAGDSVSFGNWKAYPTSGTTYTITQNGTYTFEQLSQYDQIVINVSGGSTPPSVSNNVLQFNDNTTSVSGNTLNLGVSATVSDKTLQF